MNTRKIISVAVGVLVPIALLAWWYLASAGSLNPFFPPLRDIVVRFKELWLFDHFATDVLPSLGNLFVGFAIAVILGVALGFAMATVPVLNAMLSPVVQFLRGIPPVALIPILITLVGFGNEMRVASIVIAAMFPTMLSTIDGIRSVEPGLKDVGAVYRFSRGDRLLRVYLPSSLPQIVSGMQVSLQVAFIVMIASEMLGSSQGIGAMTLLAQQSFMSADMWAGILLLGLIGFLTNILFDLVKNRVLSWYVSSKRLERAA
ncbi:MAG: ABC transporter permease [Arthrobacter sp.]|jgi:ABC-type nitrate/sulfonate/bicarbonate transport system permease component|nr:ABC transporter permease [Arthrobacter sp.]